MVVYTTVFGMPDEKPSEKRSSTKPFRKRCYPFFRDRSEHRFRKRYQQFRKRYCTPCKRSASIQPRASLPRSSSFFNAHSLPFFNGTVSCRLTELKEAFGVPAGVAVDFGVAVGVADLRGSSRLSSMSLNFGNIKQTCVEIVVVVAEIRRNDVEMLDEFCQNSPNFARIGIK